MYRKRPTSWCGEEVRTAITVACLTLASLVMAACDSNKGSFLLRNNSKYSIARVQVLVCGQMIELKEIQVGKSRTGVYKVRSDSHYDVRVEFDSGKKLQKEVGYVTNGFDFNHEITITDTDIEIFDAKVRS